MRDDNAFDTVRGLPEPPPDGERILWQGAPSWPSVARHVFRIRWIAGYFAAVIAWQFAAAFYDGALMTNAVGASVALLAFGAATIGFFLLLSWGMTRTTVYTITSRRLVFKVGVALPLTINVPYKVMTGAGLKTNSDGTGNIAITLDAETRIPYFALWPHARPWRIGRPEPMFRCVEKPETPAAIIAQAYKTETDGRTLANVSRGAETANSGTSTGAEQVA